MLLGVEEVLRYFSLNSDFDRVKLVIKIFGSYLFFFWCDISGLW